MKSEFTNKIQSSIIKQETSIANLVTRIINKLLAAVKTDIYEGYTIQNQLETVYNTYVRYIVNMIISELDTTMKSIARVQVAMQEAKLSQNNSTLTDDIALEMEVIV